MAKEVILVHPTLGERQFDAEHAKKLMALENNGGWEYKKPKKEDAANNRSNSGKPGAPEEERDHT